MSLGQRKRLSLPQSFPSHFAFCTSLCLDAAVGTRYQSLRGWRELDDGGGKHGLVRYNRDRMKGKKKKEETKTRGCVVGVSYITTTTTTTTTVTLVTTMLLSIRGGWNLFFSRIDL
ncbi:hypothetical protein DY000_02040295 [Brassica cretica]|uniref:Transmembrane protein n=1 Tax=Brassica cretica TaxID=69181 RepID=A0ABQ7BDL1_BRACR|nr:hypothetical protein DY000_02040295 [Brassica cretica]